MPNILSPYHIKSQIISNHASYLVSISYQISNHASTSCFKSSQIMSSNASTSFLNIMPKIISQFQSTESCLKSSQIMSQIMSHHVSTSCLKSSRTMSKIMSQFHSTESCLHSISNHLKSCIKSSQIIPNIIFKSCSNIMSEIMFLPCLQSCPNITNHLK